MPPTNRPGTSDARNAALLVLNIVETSRCTLDQAMEEQFPPDHMISNRERALAMAIIYGVLRWRGRLDWIITHFSKTPLAKIDPIILNIIRIGLFQITHLSRIPASAAVNTSVELSKAYGRPFITRYVNGVLRNAARSFQTVPFPSIEANPVQSLAATHSFPEWMLTRWTRRFGIAETIQLCDAVNTIPPITIRVNPLKTSRETVQNALSHLVEKISVTPYSPDGLHILGPANTISDFQEFRNGLFQVQDEAAQLVAYLLSPQPEETVLDACAGLGGKTAHIAQMMKNRGSLTAMDHRPAKLDRLSSEMKRMGITIVHPIVQDITQEFTAPISRQYDRVLLDAPCSGIGVLRRNPDGKWSDIKRELARFQQNQLALMQRLAAVVKPGGILVYAVCSFEPEENENLIETFLKDHPQFSVERPTESFPESAATLVDPKGYLKTYPHRHGTDGFFGARLHKKVAT